MHDMNVQYLSRHFVLSTILFLFSSIFSLAEVTSLSVYCCCISVIVAVFGFIKKEKQIFSLQVVLWIFSSLYALSTPLNMINGRENDPTFLAGNLEKNVNVFLLAYCISSIAFLLSQIHSNGKSEHYIDKVATINESIVKKGCILSAFLTSFFEIINLVRIGGISMLFEGKGVYQSLVGDLFLTLPSASMYCIYGLFMGIAFALDYKINSKIRNVSMVIILPFIVCKVLLGMRGALVSAVLCGIASYSTIKPVKKIKFKTICYIFIAYCFLVFLNSNRSLVFLILSDPAYFFSLAFDIDRFFYSFNPSNSEFGAAFGNFCVFYEKYGMDFSWKWGMTYLEGLLVPIPSFILPFEKPVQITYLFRNEFFASWADRSRIASTGFSSILEAYINWGFIGIFVVYYVVGKCMAFLDEIRKKSSNLLSVLISSSFVNLSLSFSRTAFGGLASEYIWIVIYIIIIYTVCKKIKIKI